MALPHCQITRNPALLHGQIETIFWGMSLDVVLEVRLNAALALVRRVALTPRDARLPADPGKVHAVIGMRRAGDRRDGVSFTARRSSGPSRAVC